MLRFTLNPKTAHIFRTLVTAAICFAFIGGQAHAQQDPPSPQGNDSLRFPIRDRYGDPYVNPNRNTFDLRDTSFVKRTIEYDPVTGQ